MSGRVVIFLALAFFLGGCATVPRVVPPQAGEIPLQSICQKYAMDCRWDGVAQTVTMDYHGTKIQALVGSDVVLVGNARLSLGAPLSRRKGAVMVPPDFERVVIGPASPLTGAPQGLPKRIGKIVIDAGHGGKVPGAIGITGVKEKDITLDIARRLRSELEKSGVDVILTRDKDEALSLERRAEIASRPDVDLFVSIHANSTPIDKRTGSHGAGSRAHGIEVYYSGALGSGDRSDDQRRLNERKLCGQFKMNSGCEDAKKIVLNMLYNYKLSVGPGMADRMARNLSRAMDEKSRGAKPERYFVLRNTLVPAILIEVGFLSNPQEERRLNDPAYRQRIAEAAAESIVEYLYASKI
jgi:N-acetylmuramoyl-L-alanine amidase